MRFLQEETSNLETQINAGRLYQFLIVHLTYFQQHCLHNIVSTRCLAISISCAKRIQLIQ